MQETRDYYASEGIPYFFLKGLENCVGSYIIAKHAVITAFATAFIAWFTYTLWNANREQIKRTREFTLTTQVLERSHRMSWSEHNPTQKTRRDRS